MKKLNELLSLITLLSILIFTGKYIWIIKLLVYLFLIFLSSFNLLYMGYINDYEFVDSWKEIIQKSSYILLSEGQGNDDEFNRIRDFIKLTQQNGSGSYPEDFSYQGYIKDDSTITHSKAPKDWGVNEDYNFGNYSDVLKRKESAIQAAKWLEYDYRVNEKRTVSLHSDDQTFNASGKKWFIDYCKNKNISYSTVSNDYMLRTNIRALAGGKS